MNGEREALDRSIDSSTSAPWPHGTPLNKDARQRRETAKREGRVIRRGGSAKLLRFRFQARLNRSEALR